MSAEEPRRESDQLPEEGPAGQVPDDAPGEAREGAERNPGGADEPDTATGNPRAAGARRPDESG